MKKHTILPAAGFRIGGIYRTQGGELRKLIELDGTDDGMITACAGHVNTFTGDVTRHGGLRRLADGLYPGASANPNHRAHLLQGEVVFNDDNVVDAEVHKHTGTDDETLMQQHRRASGSEPGKPSIWYMLTDGMNTGVGEGVKMFLGDKPLPATMAERDAAGVRRQIAADLAKGVPLQEAPKAKPSPFSMSPDLARTSHQIDPGHGSALIRLGQA